MLFIIERQLVKAAKIGETDGQPSVFIAGNSLGILTLSSKNYIIKYCYYVQEEIYG